MLLTKRLPQLKHWVSSLAYPNSLGTKGYVVVIVVVVDDASYKNKLSTDRRITKEACGVIIQIDFLSFFVKKIR